MSANTTLLGPHHRREMALLVSGEKPVAMLSYRQVLSPELQDACDEGRILTTRSCVNGIERLYLCQADKEPDMRELKAIFETLDAQRSDDGRSPITLEQHERIGQLLGYPPEAIAAFLERKRAQTQSPLEAAHPAETLEL